MKRFITSFCLALSLLASAAPLPAQHMSEFIQSFDASNLTRSDKRFLQTALAFEGHYQGLLDGDWGRLSREAFERYSWREFGAPPEDWHMVMLALSLFQRYDADGWEIRYFDNLGLSFLIPAKTILFDAPSAQFSANWRHGASSLSYSFGRHDQGTAQKLHDFTVDLHEVGSEPYSVRKTNFAVTSAVKLDGSVLYTRSNFVNGAWATLMLSADRRDVDLLNAVSASIDARRAEAIAFTPGGRLEQALNAAIAMMEEDGEPGSPPAPTAKASERPEPSGPSAGSGFYVSESGHVMTNAHVVEGCTSLSVDGKPATLVKASEDFDLALLHTRPDPGKAVAVFSAGPAKLNSDVTVIGYPYAGLLSGLNVTRGSVSSMTGMAGDATTMQVTAPVQQGNSGGPLVGADGEVVGVVVSKLNVLKFADLVGDVPQNVNFAVRGEVAKLFMAQNGLDPKLGLSEDRIEPVELARRASEFTAFIECE